MESTIDTVKNNINFKNGDNIVANINSDQTGNININSSRVVKAGDPVQDIDLVNKQYVDAIINGHLKAINPHSINKSSIGLSNVENLKVNLIATQPPTQIDNLSRGYTVGSRWFDRMDNQEYTCVTSTESSAVWKRTTGIESLKNNLRAVKNPMPFDDSLLGYSVGSIWINIVTNNSFICINNILNGAVWKQTSNESGENVVGANLGLGQGVYTDKTDSKLQFKSLTGSNGTVLTSTDTEINIKSSLIQSFLLSPVPIDIMCTSFFPTLKFPWMLSEFSDFPNGKIVMYIEMTGGGADVRVVGTNGSVLGSINNIITTGFYSFDVAVPGASSLLTIEFRARNSPIKPPKIVSIILKYSS